MTSCNTCKYFVAPETKKHAAICNVLGEYAIIFDEYEESECKHFEEIEKDEPKKTCANCDHLEAEDSNYPPWCVESDEEVNDIHCSASSCTEWTAIRKKDPVIASLSAEPMKTNCLTCVHSEDGRDALYCGVIDRTVDEFTSCTEDAYQFYGDEPDSFGEGENLLISIKIKDASFKSVTYGGGGFTLVTSEDEEIIIDTSHAAALASDSFKHTQDAIIRILRMINGL